VNPQSGRVLPGPGDALVEMTGVVRLPRGLSHEPTLDDIGVRISAGDSVAVTGPPGAGKSLWLSIVGLLESFDHGSYRLCGRDVAELNDAARASMRADLFGFVFPTVHLLEERTVLDNVALSGLYRGHQHERDVREAIDALRLVGLLDRAAHRPQALTDGERRRVAVARAICGRRPVILADEPTADLDEQSKALILRLFDDHEARGGTVIAVSEDAAVADRCRRRLRMKDGRMTEAN